MEPFGKAIFDSYQRICLLILNELTKRQVKLTWCVCVSSVQNKAFHKNIVTETMYSITYLIIIMLFFNTHFCIL